MTRLITIHFEEKDPSRRGTYERMLQALNKSASINSPSTPLEIIRFSEDWTSRASFTGTTPEAQQSFVDNTNKMRAWDEVVSQSVDGQVLVIVDCDTVVLRDLSDAETILGDEDIGFTFKRPGAGFPFNSGVILSKVNDRTRAFFSKWREINEEFLRDGVKHQKFRQSYGGINQASLGYMIQHQPIGGLLIKKLACQEWNCEDSEWKNLDNNTRILHIKSGLRDACLTGKLPVTFSKRIQLYKCIEQFQKYDEQSDKPYYQKIRLSASVDEAGME